VQIFGKWPLPQPRTAGVLNLKAAPLIIYTPPDNSNTNFIFNQHITIQVNDMNQQKYIRVLAAPNNHKG